MGKGEMGINQCTMFVYRQQCATISGHSKVRNNSPIHIPPYNIKEIGT
jgi:hypothetical protein